MSSFTRHLLRSVKFCQCRKNEKLILVLNFARTERIYSVLKIVVEFFSLGLLKPKRNLVRSLIPRLSETLNKLLGVGLIDFSNVFLQTSYHTD